MTGRELYPNRPELHRKNFWRCAPCDAHVGCHAYNRRHSRTGTEPLGRLANRELRAAKMRAHAAFDPLWREGEMTRDEAYSWLARRLGLKPSNCHIGMFDVAMCDRVVAACTASLVVPATQLAPGARAL